MIFQSKKTSTQIIFNRFFLLLFAIFFTNSSSVYCQQIDPVIGTWKTFDDKTNQPTSLVKIYPKNDSIEGVVIKIFPIPGEETITHCTLCKDSRKDQPIVGMIIITDLKKDKTGHWSGGKILDPEEGEIYKVKLSTNDGKKLDVHGYIGIPIIGRSQLWLNADNP
jgi:uncharacterized protein (DUF2147 family)